MKLLNSKIVKFVAKILISLGFVFWLVLRTDWSQVWDHAKGLNMLYVVAYVGVLLSGMMISAWKWKMLLAHKDIKVDLKRCFQLYLTGAFINNFMPSTIGGDTYRTYQIGKEEKKYAAVTSSVIFDRFTGLFAVMLLTGLIAIFQWAEISKYTELKWTVVGVLLMMHAIIFFGILTRFSIWKKISNKFPKIIQEFGSEIGHYKKDYAYLKAVGISVLFGLVGLALVNWILFLGLGISIGVIQYLTVIFLISIISSLPISINNIGLKEWAYVTFFGFFGVSASAVVTVALLSRVIQMLVSFAALPMYLKSKEK
jgi:uncharacterized protein (TIRG00374 family)